ncbi:MAG: alpha/beta fold hydrolase [Candidatus Latescibacterota bacterium]
MTTPTRRQFLRTTALAAAGAATASCHPTLPRALRRQPLHVPWPDGRQLEVRTFVPEDGQVLLFHQGSPGSAVMYMPMAEAAAARGLRTVKYSRPGYGTSTPMPGRRVIDAASDAAHVLDALGAASCRSIGWSGGGPHALACAAALPDRCLAAVTIAGLAPYVGPKDWTGSLACPRNTRRSSGLPLRRTRRSTPTWWRSARRSRPPSQRTWPRPSAGSSPRWTGPTSAWRTPSTSWRRAASAWHTASTGTGTTIWRS